MKRITLLILHHRTFFDALNCALLFYSMYLCFFQKHCIPLQQLHLDSPLRKGTQHRAFPLTGRCSTFLSGCVLPEVMVLELIQWNSISHFYQIQRYGQNQNHVYLWLHSGTPEGQGNTQFNLKGSEGCDGNHQDPLSKDNLTPARH